MLYEMDTKMLIMDKTLQQVMWTLDAMNQTYYISFKTEYIEYILLYMLFREIPNLYLNI